MTKPRHLDPTRLDPTRLDRTMRCSLGRWMPMIALGCLLVPFDGGAQAQRSPDSFKSGPSSPKPDTKPEGRSEQPGGKPGAEGKADGKAGLDGKIGPNGKAEGSKADAKKAGHKPLASLKERNRLLGQLYGRLAGAEDTAVAEPIAEAIEQMWLFSGSDTVNLLMERALEALKKKDQALALRLLDNVVELAPRFAEGWNRRAYVHFVQNEYQAAVEDLRRVLALDPNHFKAIDGLGHILREVGDKSGALKAYRHLMTIHPHWSGAKDAVQELEREVGGQAL